MACFCTTHFALMAFFTTLPQFALILFALIALHFCLDVIALTVFFVPNALFLKSYFALINCQLFILHFYISWLSFCTKRIFSVLVFALIILMFLFFALLYIFLVISLHWFFWQTYVFFCNFFHYLICTNNVANYLP